MEMSEFRGCERSTASLKTVITAMAAPSSALHRLGSDTIIFPSFIYLMNSASAFPRPNPGPWAPGMHQYQSFKYIHWSIILNLLAPQK